MPHEAALPAEGPAAGAPAPRDTRAPALAAPVRKSQELGSLVMAPG